MAKRSSRYLEIRVKGRPFTFNVKEIRYRDSKGRLTKFTKKKKLSMEVVGEREVVDKKKHIKVLRPKVIKKYSQPLKKRQREITVEEVNKRIRSKIQKEKKSVFESTIDGVVKFTYVYVKKKKKRAKKGSRHGGKKSQWS